MFSAAAVLLLASTASADVTVYLTGSSAFRGSTVTAIRNLMTLTAAGHGYAYTGTSFTGATDHIFRGTMPSAPALGVVTVKCRWTGSVAGIKALNNNGTAPFLAYPASNTAYTLAPSGTPSVNADNLTNVVTPDIAMADNKQESTAYTGTALTSQKVGIIPFAWVSSKDAPAGLTNITPQNAQALYKVGFASASLFTNNNADAQDQPGGTTVYAMGRDPHSGTRLVAFAESGIGVFQSVVQWAITGTSAANTVSTINLTNADASVDAPNAGENGLTSGGTLADLLRNTTTNVTDQNFGFAGKACFIGYLGETDAARAVNGTGSGVSANTNLGCRYLSYNGVNAFGGAVKTVSCGFTAGTKTVTGSGFLTGTPLVAGQLLRSAYLPGDTVIQSVNSDTQLTVSKNASNTGTADLTTSNVLPEAIWNGSYTFWGYEYIIWRSSMSGDKLSFGNLLKTQIHDVDYFSAGLSEASMRVTRTADGGTVTQNY